MSELEYRRALKTLPREIDPERDLWSGIAARIDQPAGSVSRRPRWLSFAIAAGLTCAGLALVWRLASLPDNSSQQLAVHSAASSPWVLREAGLLKADLNAALTAGNGPERYEIARAPNRVLSASLRELDSAESELDQALRQSPDSTFLLDRMRRVQQKKARLTLRALAA